ncbi:hypothetical protein WK11_04455 [Burkholderia ubonensis]|nr:hypothetical protein WJ41_11040 [Burkholderia ubonensis]KVO17296.1 hypothetical protein WJ74_09140 [Burkholderia ubonensis]KVR11248.1 hypothetical protein WK11_04455 [Burkholderia ubonensis]KVT95723.1 hypothetical protein WK61_16215 [Burkholderia ubonensis]KWC46373.1 hypothetical protein WL51_30190 [Burkholderia ubonensis]
MGWSGGGKDEVPAGGVGINQVALVVFNVTAAKLLTDAHTRIVVEGLSMITITIMFKRHKAVIVDSVNDLWRRIIRQHLRVHEVA